MKFIKTSDGYLINPAQVQYFQIRDDGTIRVVFGVLYKGAGAAYKGGGVLYKGAGLTMRTFSDEVVITAGNNRAEAENFLNQFIAEDVTF